MLDVVFLILGLALLIKGADIFVSASVGIAKRLKIPTAIIGLTVVAMGTSAPEVVIGITASVQGANALAIGNVVGSNIFNLLFIIGLCATIKTLRFNVHELAKDFWLSIFAAILLLVFMITGGEYISRWASLIMLVMFIVYLTMLVRQVLKAQGVGEDGDFTQDTAGEGKDGFVHDIASKSKDDFAQDFAATGNGEDDNTPGTASKHRPLAIIILLALLGCALIIAGGQLAVDSATKIAASLGITERIVGLTVVAIGTSLPELITSLVACKKGENEFALGNIIGSSIFNIMFVLGIAGLISPLQYERALIFDTTFLIIGSLIALVFVYTGKRLTRREGVIMVLMYVVYMAIIMFYSV